MARGLLLAIWLVAPLHASPREELLRRVPADAGFVIFAQDGRPHWDRVDRLPLARKSFDPIERALRDKIGASFADVRDAFLSDAIALVYRPGPPDRPADEHGLFLAYAPDADRARALIGRFLDAQTQSNEIAGVDECRHAGKPYRRIRKAKGPAEFLAFDGPVILFSPHEPILRQALATDHDAVETSFRRLGVETASLAWWVNAPAFAPAIRAKSVAIPAFVADWAAIDAAAVYVDLAGEIRAGVVVAGRPEALTPATRNLLAALAEPPAVVLPGDAILSIRSRLPPRELIAFANQYLGPEARAKVAGDLAKFLTPALGRDGFAALPDCVGPDWGVAVLPFDGPVPRAVAAVRLNDGPKDVPVGRRVRDGFHLLTSLTIADWNQKPGYRLKLRGIEIDGADVRYVTGDPLPQGLQPAFARLNGFFTVATSPELVQAVQFRSDSSIRTIAVMKPSAWRDWFTTHGMLNEPLRELLGQFTRGELHLQTEPGLARLTLKMETAASAPPAE